MKNKDLAYKINHFCSKTVLGAWGSHLKFAAHRRKLLVTAPIVETNGIEDRHKEGTVLKIPYYVGLLSEVQYFGAVPQPLDE
jgi:hypothetical protein